MLICSHWLKSLHDRHLRRSLSSSERHNSEECAAILLFVAAYACRSFIIPVVINDVFVFPLSPPSSTSSRVLLDIFNDYNNNYSYLVVFWNCIIFFYCSRQQHRCILYLKIHVRYNIMQQWRYAEKYFNGCCCSASFRRWCGSSPSLN